MGLRLKEGMRSGQKFSDILSGFDHRRFGAMNQSTNSNSPALHVSTKAYLPKLSQGFDKAKARAGRAAYYLSVDRRKQYFATHDERDAAYQQTVALNELGIGGIEVSSRDEIELREMRRLATHGGQSLLEIFKAGLASLPSESATLEVAIERFITEKQAAVEAGQIKKVYLDQLRFALSQFSRSFPGQIMATLNATRVELWLRGKSLKPKSLHSLTSALKVFFNWAVKRKLLRESPLVSVSIAVPAPKRVIFSLDEARRFLTHVVTNFPDLVPLMGLHWMAGIRPETAALVDYKNIDRTEKFIRLEQGKFKQGEVEFVEGVPDTLWTWLPVNGTGLVAPPNLKRRLHQLHKSLGYGKRNPWPQDVARRTFVSHFAAFTQSVERAAQVVNHKRSSTTMRHYYRRVLLDDARAYFEMTPSVLAGAQPKPVAAA